MATNSNSNDQTIARAIRVQLSTLAYDDKASRAMLLTGSLAAIGACAAIENLQLRQAMVQYIVHKSLGVS